MLVEESHESTQLPMIVVLLASFLVRVFGESFYFMCKRQAGGTLLRRDANE